MFGALLAGIGVGAVAGLASIPHCAGMCGPLAAFACGGEKSASFRYQIARLGSYTLAGALAGYLGVQVTEWMSAPIAQAVLSWSLALGLGLAASRLWRTTRSQSVQLLRQRPTRRARPALIGLATVLLPCGALVAALLLAAGTGSPLTGAASMFAFALVSGGALLGAGLLAAKLERLGEGPRRALATALALGAIVMVLRPIDALRAEPASCHGQATTLSMMEAAE